MASYKTIYGQIVHVDARLKYCPSGQCGMMRSIDGSINLISYSTLVASISIGGWFECYGLYSATTSKHIRLFLKEYAPNLSYQDAKDCYNEGLQMNIHTRETRRA